MRWKSLIQIIFVFLLLTLQYPIPSYSQFPDVQTSKTIYASSYFKVEKNENGSYTIRPVNYTSFLVVSPTKLSVVTSTGNFDLRFPSGATITSSGNNIVVKCGNINHIFRLLEYGGYMFKPRKRVIKWNITINSSKDIPSSISFPIGGNIKPLLMLNNSILTIPEYNITFGRIIVIDANNNTFNMTYKIDKGKLYFEPENFTFDKLAYPIVIDPVIVFGSETVFSSATCWQLCINNLTQSKVLITYTNGTRNGYAIIGEVTNDTITFGSPYIFKTFSDDRKIQSIPLTSDKFVVVYTEYGDAPRARVGIVSGTTISFGSEVKIANADEGWRFCIDKISENSFIYAYDTDDAVKVKVCTVSDTTITPSSSVYTAFSGASRFYVETITENKFIICANVGNYDIAMRIGTVSGTSISFGSTYTITEGYLEYPIATRLTDTKVLLAYGKWSSTYGIWLSYGRILTISGKTITIGDEYLIAPTNFEFPETDDVFPAISSFNESAAILCTNYHGKAVYIRISGATIEYLLTNSFSTGENHYASITTINNNSFVIAYSVMYGGVAGGEAIVGTVWFETNPPTSSINPVSQYWYTTNITLTATATDTESGVANVSLYYCFSLDNSTWSDWTLYGTDTDGSDGWNWTFDFPDGMGYYQFYSIATDKAGNTESKTTADIELGKPIPCYFTYSYPINKQPILFTDMSAISTHTKWIIDGITVAEQTFPNGSHSPFNLTYTFNISNIYNITLWVYNETFDVSNTYTVNLPVKRNLTLDLSPNHIGINYVAYHLNTTTNASALMDLLNLNRGEWIHKYNESTNKWMSLWKYNDTVKLGDNFDIHPWDVVVVVISNNRTITIDITEKVNTTQTKTLQKGYHYLSWSNNTPILSCDVTKIGLQEGDWVFKYDLKNETWLSYNVGLSGDIFEIKLYDCIVVNLADERNITIGG